ncbi:MAG: GNAT family N-acetyltransferase [Actinomycetota bacterium]
MDIDVRPITSDELEAFLTVVEASFGETIEPDLVQRFAKFTDPNRMFAATDNGTIVGTAGAYDFKLTVPGGAVPAGGVTVVGVLPSHRRRGVLTKMMRTQLDDEKARGDAVAVLWASEDPIYQRFGYGAASVQGHIDIARAYTTFTNTEPQAGRIHMITSAEALEMFPVVYDRVLQKRPGMYERTPQWWEFHRLSDPESEREGFSALWHVVWEDDAGELGAYAMYRIKTSWESGFPEGNLQVDEAIGVDANATREIWRYLFGVDLITHVTAYHLPSDHPLRFQLVYPRSLRFVSGEALWLRVIDLPAALQARTYKQDGTVVMESADDFCPWNAGRWRLDVRDGKGHVAQTTDPADLELGIGELGWTYLGETTFAQLAGAGRIRQLSAGAVGTATAMFRWDVAPWCPEVF